MRTATYALVCLLQMHASTSVCLAESKKLAISIPMTGPAATYGTTVMNIIGLLNEKLDMKKFSFVTEDDRCDLTEAVHIAPKFTRVNRVNAVIVLP